MPKILPLDMPVDMGHPDCSYPGCEIRASSQVLFSDRRRRAAACDGHAADPKALEELRALTPTDDTDG